MFILLENPRSGWVFRVKHWSWMSRKQLETVGNGWTHRKSMALCGGLPVANIIMLLDWGSIMLGLGTQSTSVDKSRRILWYKPLSLETRSQFRWCTAAIIAVSFLQRQLHVSLVSICFNACHKKIWYLWSLIIFDLCETGHMSLQSNGFCLVADSTLHRSSAAATAATAATALRTAPGGAMFAASDMYGAAPAALANCNRRLFGCKQWMQPLHVHVYIHTHTYIYI